MERHGVESLARDEGSFSLFLGGYLPSILAEIHERERTNNIPVGYSRKEPLGHKPEGLILTFA